MAANRVNLWYRLLGVGMPITIVCILALLKFGSAAATVAWLRGNALFLESPEVTMGRLIAGSPRQVRFPIRNLSSAPFSVIGARTDCGCAVAGGVPVCIQPGQVAYLSIRVTPRQQDAGTDFLRTLTIFVDLHEAPISIPIRGHVAAAGRLTGRQPDRHALPAESLRNLRADRKLRPNPRTVWSSPGSVPDRVAAVNVLSSQLNRAPLINLPWSSLSRPGDLYRRRSRGTTDS